MYSTYPGINYFIITTLIFINIFYSSCVSTKKTVYFNNVSDSVILSNATNLEPTIQKNDLLSISVSSLSTEAVTIFNSPNTGGATSNTSTGTTSSATGYLVTQDGNIQFPLLGDIKAAGLTRNELKTYIRKNLTERKLLLDPIVNIRFLNFKITVLGEVAHPSVVNVVNEKISLLEALGLAGDVTIYGRKDNVLVIREEGERKILQRINLNSAAIFTSPYYYLRSNDIVYVEANKAKVATSGRASLLIPVLFSALSFVTIVVDRLLR